MAIAVGANGGVLGPYNTPVRTGAKGVWMLNEQFRAQVASTWPLVTEPEAVTWASAVTANGGTYTGTHLAAVSDLITGLKSDGLWTKMKLFMPLAGNELAAAAVIYKSGSWTTWASSTQTFSNGLQASATTYTDSGFNPSTAGFTAGSIHVASYQIVDNVNIQTHLGTKDGSSNGIGLEGPFTADTKVYTEAYSYSAGFGQTSATPAGRTGFFVGSRTSSIDFKLFRNTTNISSIGSTAGSIPSLNVYIGAKNSAGSPIDRGIGKFCLISIGDGLSIPDVVAYYARVQTYQTALSRNV